MNEEKRNTRKDKKKENKKYPYKKLSRREKQVDKKVMLICFLIMIGIYGFDCVILTPFALTFFPVEEVGPLASWGFERYGMSYFPTFFLFFVIFSWGLMNILYSVQQRFPHKSFLLRNSPILANTLVWFVGMIFVIVNNISVMSLYF